jgi:hypothetical protein
MTLFDPTDFLLFQMLDLLVLDLMVLVPLVLDLMVLDPLVMDPLVLGPSVLDLLNPLVFLTFSTKND